MPESKTTEMGPCLQNRSAVLVVCRARVLLTVSAVLFTAGVGCKSVSMVPCRPGDLVISLICDDVSATVADLTLRLSRPSKPGGAAEITDKVSVFCGTPFRYGVSISDYSTSERLSFSVVGSIGNSGAPVRVDRDIQLEPGCTSVTVTLSDAMSSSSGGTDGSAGREGSASGAASSWPDASPDGGGGQSGSCSEGNCTKRAAGQPCSTGSECEDGHCEQGACCRTSCGAICMSCSVVGREGNCVNVPSDGTDPQKRCEPSGACGYTGRCDGNAQCSFASVDTVCGEAKCVSQSASVDASRCDGAGSCVPPAAQTCEDSLICNDRTGQCGVTCSNNSQCQSGKVCDPATRMCGDPPGTACSSNRHCASGNCIDEHCCTQSSCGKCTRCGTSGSCEPIVGEKWQADCGQGEICSGANQCVLVCAFADPFLEKFVRGLVNKPSGLITQQDVAGITELNYNGLEQGFGIETLDGAECLRGITGINISNTFLSDISALSAFSVLKTVSLADNRIKDVSPLAGQREKFTSVQLSGNQIEDVTPLANIRFDQVGFTFFYILQNKIPCSPAAGSAAQLAALQSIWDNNSLDFLDSDCLYLDGN